MAMKTTASAPALPSVWYWAMRLASPQLYHWVATISCRVKRLAVDSAALRLLRPHSVFDSSNPILRALIFCPYRIMTCRASESLSDTRNT